ncbi:two-component system sensor histidine kinase NtrB [Neisseria wadsworthii]|uniref:histidine kinase n=1 Tax=Neisseria wadsworthii 9715 TaxID=1030841 RepID=G4CTM9_9NEIS|nr:HAMP domain-containing sensor histidine kinase [Neisseria wadsworthii]EGZ44134.1 sensor histidine kinase [Neisseria wadsworthii 9715]QMT36008.1 HAMP domain-containing histidine kinase [Neisseria wadsworthii]
MSYAKAQLYSRRDWEQQMGRLPVLINLARVTIIISLLVFQIGSDYLYMDTGKMGSLFKPVEFYTWAAIYGGIVILTLFKPEWQRQNMTLPNAAAVADISMIMLLVYMTGGIGMGFGALVLPFVATSCLLSYGRYPMLYASYATLLIIFCLLLSDHMIFNIIDKKWNGTDFRPFIIGLFLIGASYLVAGLTSLSVNRLKAATDSADKHKQAFNRVSGLNKLVLNRVQEAVVVLDMDQRIWLFNAQAKTYFPSLAIDNQETIFSDLIRQWHHAPEKSFETDIHLHQHSMRVRAVPLVQSDEKTELLMLFIRSLREVAAEAMATKLASLGQLTANLAHEIRNPMSAIRHANDLLQESMQDPTNAKLHDIIDSNIRRIDKMLEDVTSLNKKDNISREKINLMKFWLAFKQEFTLNNPDAIGSVRMTMEGNNLAVVADSMHLQQIMWNLCNNAWRHSRKDNQAITVLMRPSGKMHISIVVADNGSGVAPEVRNRLFEPFFTTEKTGTGLGLYVARELAHANLGQLHYHPEMNGFELILPRDESNDEA